MTVWWVLGRAAPALRDRFATRFGQDLTIQEFTAGPAAHVTVRDLTTIGPGPVSVADPGAGLVTNDAVIVVDHLELPSARFNGPAEAFIRLVSGRLKAPYDKGVTVEGSVTLDDLRRVFLGF